MVQQDYFFDLYPAKILDFFHVATVIFCFR